MMKGSNDAACWVLVLACHAELVRNKPLHIEALNTVTNL